MAKKIKVNIFNDMKEALHDAAAYEREVVREPERCAELGARHASSSAGRVETLDDREEKP